MKYTGYDYSVARTASRAEPYAACRSRARESRPTHMQLTLHTDYALRTLILLAVRAPERLTVADVSQTFDVSEHHLLKVVQHLAELGYVDTQRGKAGGVRLAVDPALVNLGQLVRETEAELGVVGCLREGSSPCVIEPACHLKLVLRHATERFLESLAAWTLADLLKGREHSLGRLVTLRPKAGVHT
jgi:Rrf2 family nitric oxide-sensitive transcriptional repressor